MPMTPEAPTAPYLRIAAAIELQIRTGELRPGDFVPSARQLMRDYGVAMATASKALAELRRQGVARPVPGVGTVVMPPSPTDEPADRTDAVAGSAPTAPPTRTPTHTGAHDEALSRARIVAAAITVADIEGLGALTMRRVASALGVATMSTYRHVAHKGELVLLMADAVFAEERTPATSRGWRNGLEASARAQWNVYRRHPWLAQVVSVTRPQALPHGVAHTEAMLAAFDGLGLDAAEVLHATVTLVTYVRGVAVNLEGQARDEQDSGVSDDEWMRGQETVYAALSAGRFPHLARMTARPVDLDLESLFEFGLQRLLDGYAALIGRAAAR
ncbi:TetR/AcrR family transcriptional regulator C-terminal domain-containing protein [Agromyces bauzanensis]